MVVEEDDGGDGGEDGQPLFVNGRIPYAVLATRTGDIFKVNLKNYYPDALKIGDDAKYRG